MKTMCLDDSIPSRSLVARESPTPTPSLGEILIRVHASGVTPSEVVWYPSTHTKTGEARRNAIPGHEFSGVVAALGEGVSDFAVGDEIYGMNDWFAEGATAEYCLALPAHITRKPAKLSHAEAATIPIAALTAGQGLFDRAKLKKGERVLIHGGAGAVGVFAIQLARQIGAQVFATASARHRDFLDQLGADHVIDYQNERFEDQLRDLDVVFDGVGGKTRERSWSVLKPGGRLVTIAADGEGEVDDRTKAAFFIVEPSQRQLVEISALLERGLLQTSVDGVVPLEQASIAYFGKPDRRNGTGKVVVSIRE